MSLLLHKSKGAISVNLPRPFGGGDHPPCRSSPTVRSQLREAPGNHMLSQLGPPASNRDTLTLIHSTWEVLSLALGMWQHKHRHNHTPLHRQGSPEPLFLLLLLLPVWCSSLSPLLPSLLCFSLGGSFSSQRAVLPQAALSFLLFICLKCLAFPLPPVNISLWSSQSLISSLVMVSAG